MMGGRIRLGHIYPLTENLGSLTRSADDWNPGMTWRL